VQIRSALGAITVTYELIVAPDETGKVIGTQRTGAKSIRDLMVLRLRGRISAFTSTLSDK